jgi:hypothetical protein
MNPKTNLLGQPQFDTIPSDFWQRLVNNPQLESCSDLQKLLVGCEIIAAVDEIEILLAA